MTDQPAMTAPRRADGFQLGDRVLVIGPYAFGSGVEAIVSGVDMVRARPVDRDMEGIYRPDDLELIDAQKVDEPVPADPAMPADPSGQAPGNGGSAGPAPEYPEQAETFVRFDVATPREQAEAIADLTQRFDALELSHNFLLRGFLELRDEIRNPQPN